MDPEDLREVISTYQKSVADNPDFMQTTRMNHEWRMGAIEDLMLFCQLVNVPEEVGLSERMQA
jgi:hypothetical protein